MARKLNDWLTEYVKYASYSEAPRRMHFWTGVSAVAGALRRKVWMRMGHFSWHVNFYILLVAPPGIVAKSTTADIAMNLLRKVPGINFGPDVVTWQALVKAFAERNETFKIDDTHYTQCALTLSSSEFGNLLNPHDREMVDLLVTLWDSRQGGLVKVTKMSGSDLVENPWINIIACTTPSWIAGNFPEYMIGGGFTSRCLFVYGETKDKYSAYPFLDMPEDLDRRALTLIQDLEHIATFLAGPYRLTSGAIKWGQAWYESHYKNRPADLDESRFGGYFARKQTHIHKLSMILAASQRDELIVTEEDLALANTMVTDLEPDMHKVFDKIGQTNQSTNAERMIEFIRRRKVVSYEETFRYIHMHFPHITDFEGILNGAIRAKFVQLVQTPNGMMLKALDIPAPINNE